MAFEKSEKEPLCKYFIQLEDDVIAKKDFMRYVDAKVSRRVKT